MKEVKGLMLFADSCEDIEALGTLDLLRRANIICDTVSMTGKKEILTQSKVKIETDYLIEEVNIDNYEFLVIPGGAAVLKFYHKSELTNQIVKAFLNKHLLVAAICAAPSILGKEGYLQGIDYTCFPSFENFVVGGNYLKDKIVVVRDNIITACACGATFEFAYEIIKYLRSKAIADHVIGTIIHKNQEY